MAGIVGVDGCPDHRGHRIIAVSALILIVLGGVAVVAIGVFVGGVVTPKALMLVHHVEVLLVNLILNVYLPLLGILHSLHLSRLRFPLPLDHFLLHPDLFLLDLSVYPIKVAHNQINIS